MKELRKVKSRYEFQLESRQVVLIVSGLILVLMLSFLMGTLFGVNMGKMSKPDQAKAAPAKEATVPDQPSSDTEVARAEPTAMSDETVTDSGEKKITKSESSREDLIRELERLKVPDRVENQEEAAKEDVPSEAGSSEKKQQVKSPPQESTAEAADKDDSSTSTKQSAAKDKPQQKQKSSSSNSRHVTRAGTYTIQLASFPERADAGRMVGKLKSNMYDAYMVQVSLPEKGTFYRVRVGHYEDLEQAKKALAIIQSREGKFYDAWITQ